MARFNLLSLAVSFLAISCIVLVQCEDGEPTEEVAAEPAEKAESQPVEEGASEESESSESASAETTAPEAGAAREDGNSTSIGEEKKQDSNETMEAREEERDDGPSSSKGAKLWERWDELGKDKWPSKNCPKTLGNFYEKICIMHCWQNGWQGGRCTSSEVCVCLWNGLKLDPDASEKPWVNTPSTKKPKLSTGKPRKDNQIGARDEVSDEEMEGILSDTPTLQDTEKAAEVSSVSPSEESSVSRNWDVPHTPLYQTTLEA